MNHLTINIPSTCNSNGSLPYVFDNREDYLKLGVPLYQAASTSDWETAKTILDKHPDLVRFGLTKNLDTALHVAATAKWTNKNKLFLKNLIDMMTMDDMELKNKRSNTAFWEAAAFGQWDVGGIQIMMEKNHNLLNIRGSNGLLPLSISVSTIFCVPTMKFITVTVRYLYDSSQKMSGDHWTDKDKDSTLVNCVENEMHDVAVQILEDHPELARNVSLLKVLARMPDAFDIVEKNLITRILESTFIFLRIKVQPTAEEDSDALKILKIIWGHATRTMNIDEIEDMLRGSPTSLADGTIQYSSKILFVAAENGITEFIVELLRTYPDLVLDTNEDGLSIFHVAVMRRYRDIYNLLYDIGGSYRKAILMLKDKSNNNMLHLVGKTSKDMTTKNYGASLLLQRELLWLEEVHSMIPSYLREEKNKDGQTPYELFSKENEDEVSKGLQWMKDCMVVATLIVTVAFAIVFTVPGGYKAENGLPFFIDQRTFLVFVTADAISLFSSSTSLLVFLSILTSRHDHFDFFKSLPRKLMVGLLTLFISVAAMMVTFSVSFFVLYHKGLKWVPIIIAIFATLPVVVFARLQFPVLVDMFRSTYDERYLFEPKKHMLYTTKPKVTL